jgi:hypothetical protein
MWKERNARVFERTSSTIDRIVAEIAKEGGVWATAGFSMLSQMCALWSQNGFANKLDVVSSS